MRVLVAATCCPDDRITLCAVRSLAGEGIEVLVGGDRFAGRAFFSRYIGGKLKYPHPAVDARRFLDSLADHAARERIDVILPTSDYTVGAMVEGRGQLGGLARHCLPSESAWQLFRDKWETLSLANKLGIRAPKTYCCGNETELRSLLGSLDYPLVVKPRKSAGAIGFFLLGKPSDLPPDCFQAASGSDAVFDFQRPLVQEYIPGEIHDVCLLFNHGEPRAALTQKRLKMYPSSGGAGILNVTTDEPELKEQAIALLKAAQWHGPAQVEFKRGVDGRDYLMEVNGRLWGTLDLAVAAGINFPLLASRIAARGDVRPVTSYHVGLSYRWPWPYGILNAAETGRWFRTLGEFFGAGRGVKSDLWMSDLVPVFAEIVFAGQRFLSNRKAHRAGNAPLRRMRQVFHHKNC